ncbi:MAG: ABC transporter permease, partial [Gammaproteobacteria bacterium]|nr:ABC transporter permease [Gammaproteobacteria bacterium]
MPVKLLIQLSWRNIWRHRRRNAILVSAIAVAVTGVMLLNTMMRGMQQDLRNTAIENLTGHVKILEPGYLHDPGIERGFEVPEGWQNALPDHVVGWASRIRVPGVIMSERGTRGIQLVGVDPARESISFLGQAEVAGDRLSGPEDSRILIGGLL